MTTIRKILFAALIAVLPLFLPAMAGPVNINTADAATIASAINGIGETKAQAIVDYRQQHGPFASVYDLTKVKGIGKKTVEKNLDNLTVDPVQTR
ncbi:MAG: ComEA family DNA-binding protein [Chromatiales bacterium]|jgi:competence protein ComEA|nr:ComEA family DNA-binding protein [Chromatiales bacterium]MDX9765716.1 ComEA family DNA-binding protein [Ectothiorhodospiraceae bacterium]